MEPRERKPDNRNRSIQNQNIGPTTYAPNRALLDTIMKPSQRFGLSKLSKLSEPKDVKERWKRLLERDMKRTIIGGEAVKYYRVSEEGKDESYCNLGETADWGGRYLGMTIAYAEGYATLTDDQFADFRAHPKREMIMTEYTFNKGLLAVEIPEGFTNVTGEYREWLPEGVELEAFKAEVLKEVLGIDSHQLLVNELGRIERVYLGVGAEKGAQEIAMAWDFKPEGMEKKIIRRYTITKNNYGVGADCIKVDEPV